MESKLEVLGDVRFRNCRNDEWVGLIPALPEAAWMTRDGTIGFGPMSWRGRIRERIADDEVRVELVREPPWSPAEMNGRARRLLGIDPSRTV